jgi:hypothetical protein
VRGNRASAGDCPSLGDDAGARERNGDQAFTILASDPAGGIECFSRNSITRTVDLHLWQPSLCMRNTRCLATREERPASGE